MKYLKQKVEAGSDAILTQLTFSAEKFCTFVDKCREVGISQDIPIIPGLYVPRDLKELDLILKYSKADIPSELYENFEKLSANEDEFQEFSLASTVKCIEHIQENCSEFIRGFHFYTMNNLNMLQKLTQIVNFSEES